MGRFRFLTAGVRGTTRVGREPCLEVEGLIGRRNRMIGVDNPIETWTLRAQVRDECGNDISALVLPRPTRPLKRLRRAA